MTKIAYPATFLIATAIGTGAYVLFPAVMYLLLGVGLSICCVLVMKKVHKINKISNAILFLYLVFLLSNLLRDFGNDVIVRLYVNFFLGLCAYLIVIKTFSLQVEVRRFRYLPLISLMVISSGIILQLNGLISFRGDSEGIAEVDEGVLLRPGGFLNPNMSAALSLIWLFCALESKMDCSYWIKSACIALCLFIISISQSRAALLFLSIYFLYKIFDGSAKKLKYYAIPIVVGFLLFAFSSQRSVLEDVYTAFLTRLEGDGSSRERYYLLQNALATFTDNPIIGRGMRAMFKFFGLGTHNEIVEWLVNFGVTGLLVMLLVFFRFYYVNSLKYLILCILPTFVFSHNFFETTAFQIALACAFSLARTPEGKTVRTVRRRRASRVPIAAPIGIRASLGVGAKHPSPPWSRVGHNVTTKPIRN